MATLTSNSLSISSDLNLGEYDLSLQALNHTDSIKQFSFYSKTNTSLTGTFIADSFLGYGGSVVVTGSFVKNPLTFNSFLFNFSSNASQISSIEFEGKIQADTVSRAKSGYYNHLGVTYTTGDKVDFYGKNDYSANTLNLDSARFQSADGQTLLLKGAIFFKENVNQLYGKLSGFTYSDGQGHINSLSGISVDITSLSKTTSLTDLVPQLMSQNDNEVGTNADEVMYGFDGNDTLNGGNGADTLIGGNGDDTYLLTINSPDQIQETSNGGFDTVVIATNNAAKTAITLNVSDYTYIEGLKVSGTGLFNLNGDNNNNRLTGNASDNSIAGGDGNDTLAGSGGNDTLSGGAGDDTFVLVNNNSTVDEKISEGLDTVEIAFANAGSVITLDLGNYANIENLTVSGTGLYQLIGSSANNLLKGNASANTINGNGGDDTMDGGAGDDVYIVDSTSDEVAETQPISTGGYDTVFSSVNFTLGDNIEKLVLSGTNNSRGTGNASGNLIVGNEGDNTLDGGAGADTLQGGKGRDTYYVDDVNDVIVDGDANSIIYSTSANYKLGSNFISLTLIGTGDINATGNFKNNLLIGNAGNNILNGGYGHDTLIGGSGDDTYILDLNALDEVHEEADGGTDTLWFTNHNGSATPITLNVADYQNIDGLRVSGIGLYNLMGDAHNNILTGNTYANLIDAGLGNDTLVSGGGGKDTLIGGAGDDLYVLTGRSVTITELANQGNDTLQVAYDNTGAAIAIQLASFANVENIQVTGQGQFNLTGNEIGNVITGNADINVIAGLGGNDTLAGGGGADTLVGGIGDDQYLVSNLQTLVQENSGDGADGVVFTLDNANSVAIELSAFDNVENYLIQGNGLFNLTANSLDNQITGNQSNNFLMGGTGNDTLIGGGGADTLNGGDGNDTYNIDKVDDVVVDSGGIDKVNSSITYSLGSSIENLNLTGISAIDGNGNSLDNVITGNQANNRLDGATGADTLIGGAGNDTLLGGNVLTQMSGGEGNDVYYVANRPFGSLSFSGTPHDYVTLGQSYSYSESTGVFSANLFDTNKDGLIDYLTINYEEKSFSLFWHLSIGVNHLGANENLHVGEYFNAEEGPFASEGHPGISLGGDGRADSAVTGYFEIKQIDIDYSGQSPILRNFSVSFTQNSFNIFGNQSLSGNLEFKQPFLSQQVTELANQGDDLVISSTSYQLTDNVERLTLSNSGSSYGIGNALDNLITGDYGNNTLDGAAGQDTLIGGASADYFMFSNLDDSTATHPDQINDLSHAELDKIDLSSLDADALNAGKQDFNFIQSSAFSNTAGELRFENGYLSGDTNGDGQADFMVHLLGVTTLSASDLILS